MQLRPVVLAGTASMVALGVAAASTSADSLFAGSAFAGSAFAGSAFAGSAFAGSAFAGSAFAGSAFAAGTSAGSSLTTRGELPASQLAVFANGRWQPWWKARNAPTEWRAALPTVSNAVRWLPTAADGVEWGELRISGNGEAWRLRVILVRIDPRRVTVQLDKFIRGDSLGGSWTVDSAPDDAVLAIDAGQFSYGRPWGWVVRRGVEEQGPGRGPLSTGVLVDSSGMVTLVPASDLPGAAAHAHPLEAFQSYPTLLTGDGDIPAPVRGVAPDTASAIDLAHRDSRLAMGTLRDGRVLVALTRFDGLGGAFAVVPFGPTVPEMAAIMGALGCHSAVMLDGGISGQMLLRDHDGTAHKWPGWRAVPIGIIVRPRAAQTRALQTGAVQTDAVRR